MSSILRHIDVFTLFTLLLCSLYAAFAWTPSYGLVLRIMGAEDTGTVLGSPRAIRSDE